MKGIYIERDIYEPSELTLDELVALQTLGIKVRTLPGGKVKILEDTSEQEHSVCGDEDILAMARRTRREL